MSGMDWSSLVSAVHSTRVPTAQLLEAGFESWRIEDASFGEDSVSIGALNDIEVEPDASGSEAYKASDWTRNPATNEIITVVAADGTGSLIGPWKRDKNASFDACPIVFLGSEGVVSVLAPNLASFVYLLLSGNHTYDWANGDKMRFASLLPEITALLAPGIDADKARAAFEEAQALTPEFQALMQSHRGE